MFVSMLSSMYAAPRFITSPPKFCVRIRVRCCPRGTQPRECRASDTPAMASIALKSTLIAEGLETQFWEPSARQVETVPYTGPDLET
jgi:hypothetical protein